MEPYEAFKLYQKVCKTKHTGSLTINSRWSFKWAGAKDFAIALGEFAERVKQQNMKGPRHAIRHSKKTKAGSL